MAWEQVLSKLQLLTKEYEILERVILEQFLQEI